MDILGGGGGISKHLAIWYEWHEQRVKQKEILLKHSNKKESRMAEAILKEWFYHVAQKSLNIVYTVTSTWHVLSNLNTLNMGDTERLQSLIYHTSNSMKFPQSYCLRQVGLSFFVEISKQISLFQNYSWGAIARAWARTLFSYSRRFWQ